MTFGLTSAYAVNIIMFKVCYIAQSFYGEIENPMENGGHGVMGFR